MNYQLLDVNEPQRTGDIVVLRDVANVPHRMVLRPVSATWPEPIPMSERKPTREDADKFSVVLGWREDSKDWRYLDVDHISPPVTHWLPLPPAPVSADDAAFEAWCREKLPSLGKSHAKLRAAWKAALDYARKTS